MNSGSPLSFQWQLSTDNGFTWNPISNNSTYSGATSNNLGINADLGLNGYRYRCAATNSFGSAISDIAQLTVSATTASGSWRQQYYGTTANTGNAADNAAPDGDNIPNLIKYALVIVPGTSGAASMPAAQTQNNRLTLIFTRDLARNDITIKVQSNSALTGLWTTLATSVNGAAFTGSGFINETNGPGGLKTIEVRDTENISASSARFMHIEVTR